MCHGERGSEGDQGWLCRIPSFGELDSRNSDFDSAAAPGQGESVEDGVVVAHDAGDERVQRGQVIPFRWSDFDTVYQGGTSWFAYREHVATHLTFSLVHTDGRVVSFDGTKDRAYYEIVKWAPVLEAEIIRELLPPLLAKIRAGEQLSFGAVTIGLNGITTPKGMTSWAELTDLHTRTGYLVVGVGRRQWKHPVAKIPNFPIFWGMVRHLFDSRRGVETD